MARLYDAMTDTFLTERGEIVDSLVRLAAVKFTYAQREHGDGVKGAQIDAFLREARDSNLRRAAIQSDVRASWRAWVDA